MAIGRWLDRLHALTAPAPIVVEEREDLLEAALELAQTQILAQLAEETSIDGETMGLLAFLGALLAVDVAAKDLLGTWWWTPLVGIGLATIPCLRSVFAGAPDIGPGSRDFYRNFGGHPSKIAREILLADLEKAFGINAIRARAKRRRLREAVVVIIVGLIGASLMITLDRPNTLKGNGRHGKSAAAASNSAACTRPGGPRVVSACAYPSAGTLPTTARFTVRAYH